MKLRASARASMRRASARVSQTSPVSASPWQRLARQAGSGYGGVAAVTEDGIYNGALIEGDLGLGFRTSLGPEEAQQVLEAVEPFDPDAELNDL